MTPRQKALIALFLTMSIWGFGAVATRFLVKDLDPADVIVIRYVISTACFALLLALVPGPGLVRGDWLRFIFCGLAGVTTYTIAASYGMQTTPASLAGLILGAEPVMIALIAAVVLGDRLTRPVMAGLALAAVGTAVLVLGRHGVDAIGAAAAGAGPWMVLFGAASWSAYAVAIRPLLRSYGAIRATSIASLIGSLPLFALTQSSVPATLEVMTGLQWLVLLFLAIPATVVSLVLWNYGNRHVSAGAAAAFIYAVPVVSVAAGVMVLGEELSPSLVLGGLLVLAGVALAQFAPRRMKAA